MEKNVLRFLIILMLFLFPVITFAQSDAPLIMPEKIEEIQITPEKTAIDYTLPYSGISTDHPLFFLKSFRDYLMEMFISDLTKKVEYYLLQSDKYFGMGLNYIDSQNNRLAISVFNSSLDYTDKAISMISKAKNDNTWTETNVLDKLDLSIQKHIELFKNIQSKITEKNEYERILQKMITQETDIQKLKTSTVK